MSKIHRINTRVDGQEDITQSKALELLSNMYSSDRNRNLERKLASIVTDVCDDCLGTGSLQFCGVEVCPSCAGTGNPPTEIKVYECVCCGAQSLDSDLSNFTLCSPMSTDKKHEFVLKYTYSKVTK